jgi:ribonuclease P protein component
LNRRYSLRDKALFRQVRQSGKSYAHPLLVLCCLPNQEVFSRCGFTVSRRIGKAVERNRARRRISEAVRLLWDMVVPGWDMVWVARPGINKAEFSELQSVCARLLRRARLLKAPDGKSDMQDGATAKGLSEIPAEATVAPPSSADVTMGLAACVVPS